MKSKLYNYILTLSFLIIGFSVAFYNQNDHHGGQNIVNKQKLNSDVNNKIITNEYDKTLNKSKIESKKVLLFFIDTNCDWSDKFYETIKDNDVNKFLSDNDYLKYYVNIDQDPDLFKKYKVSSTPWYVIIDENEKVLKTGSGYKQKREFLLWLKNIVKKPTLNK